MLHKFEIKPREEYLSNFYSNTIAGFRPDHGTFERILDIVERVSNIDIDDIDSRIVGIPGTSLELSIRSPLSNKDQILQAIQGKLDRVDGRLVVVSI